jgi:hypothetical protein
MLAPPGPRAMPSNRHRAKASPAATSCANARASLPPKIRQRSQTLAEHARRQDAIKVSCVGEKVGPFHQPLNTVHPNAAKERENPSMAPEGLNGF